jgi:hypothetical protein
VHFRSGAVTEDELAAQMPVYLERRRELILLRPYSHQTSQAYRRAAS